MYRILLTCAMLASASGARYAVVGDWGRAGRFAQRAVADQMRARNVSFVISTGDNFYPRGIRSTADPTWLQWEDVYRPRVPWYVALGNHDYRGNPDAQVQLTDAHTFWNMPARYYDIVDDVHIFVLDTTPWVSGGDVSAQKKWLTTRWRSSNALRKVMVGHHPLWTCGYHHKRENLTDLRATVIPLLRDGVYLAGHDHNLQHIQREGVNVFISGAGATTYDVKTCDGLLFGDGKHPGFLLVEDDAYSFVTADGSVVYSI